MSIHLDASPTDKHPACLRESKRYAYPPRFGWDCTADTQSVNCSGCKKTTTFREAVHAHERAKAGA